MTKIPETDYRYDRCVRNERKLDMLEQKVEDNGDKLLRLDVKIDNIRDNHLRHVIKKGEAFNKKNVKDVALWLTPSVIVAIISNLDKITAFIEWLRVVILGG